VSGSLTILDHEPPTRRLIRLVMEDMRNSWQSYSKGDTTDDALGSNDRALARRLAVAGSSHGKWARQLPIYVRIKAPDLFWRQFDTHSVGVKRSDEAVEAFMAGDVTQNSTSVMHLAGKVPFADANFTATVDPAVIDGLNAARMRWIDGGRRRGDEHWEYIAHNMPAGFFYTRGISMNYAVAQQIAVDRRNHRVDEWAQLLAFFRTLPDAAALIFLEEATHVAA
jgi:hypothetical protein